MMDKESTEIDIHRILPRIIGFHPEFFNSCTDKPAPTKNRVTVSKDFEKEEMEKIRQHVLGIILLPLRDNRTFQHEYIENTISLINFYQPNLP